MSDRRDANAFINSLTMAFCKEIGRTLSSVLSPCAFLGIGTMMENLPADGHLRSRTHAFQYAAITSHMHALFSTNNLQSPAPTRSGPGATPYSHLRHTRRTSAGVKGTSNPSYHEGKTLAFGA